MSGGIFILVILVLFLIWLMLVRPQRRRQLNQQAMIDHLRVGDEVLTAGGFFATVVAIEEDEVTVELSPGTEARLSKRAIAAVMPEEEAVVEADEAEALDEEDEAAPQAEQEAEASEPVGEKPR
jgi:preprotein translocase subunit YajC